MDVTYLLARASFQLRGDGGPVLGAVLGDEGHHLGVLWVGTMRQKEGGKGTRNTEGEWNEQEEASWAHHGREEGQNGAWEGLVRTSSSVHFFCNILEAVASSREVSSIGIP
jgi:hypothetical protein